MKTERELRELRATFVDKLDEFIDEFGELDTDIGNAGDWARQAGQTQHMVPFTLIKGQSLTVLNTMHDMRRLLGLNIFALSARSEGVQPDDLMKPVEHSEQEQEEL